MFTAAFLHFQSLHPGQAHLSLFSLSPVIRPPEASTPGGFLYFSIFHIWWLISGNNHFISSCYFAQNFSCSTNETFLIVDELLSQIHVDDACSCRTYCDCKNPTDVQHQTQWFQSGKQRSNRWNEMISHSSADPNHIIPGRISNLASFIVAVFVF